MFILLYSYKNISSAKIFEIVGKGTYCLIDVCRIPSFLEFYAI